MQVFFLLNSQAGFLCKLHIQNYPISSFVFQTDLSQTGGLFQPLKLAGSQLLATPRLHIPIKQN